MAKNAAPFLQPGERLQVAFSAQITSPWWVFTSYWIIIIRNSYRVVIVTDRRILLAHAGRYWVTPVSDIIREVPRQTRFGPRSDLWYKMTALGEKLYVAKRYHKNVVAADALAGQSAVGA